MIEGRKDSRPSKSKTVAPLAQCLDPPLESNKATAPTRKEALAAVTVPWGLTNAGFNLAICSGVETRIPLSAVTVTVRPETNKEMTACFSVPFQITMMGK